MQDFELDAKEEQGGAAVDDVPSPAETLSSRSSCPPTTDNIRRPKNGVASN